MIVIHYPTAFKALNAYIDCFNEKAEKTTQQLKTGAVLTARELIRIYGVALLKAGDLKDFTSESLPSLQTNNKQLSRLVKCSPRSIQRHIARLRLAGIITHKTYHGSNANYELLINPEILLIKQKLTVENTKQKLSERLATAPRITLPATDSKHRKTICPHTYSCNTSNIKNNILIAVDKSERCSLSLTGECSGDITGNPAGNAGEIVPKKNMEEAGEIVSRAENSGDRNVPPDAARDNSLTLYSGLFWMMARNLLYKHTDLTVHQVSIAKKLIYGLYNQVSTEHLGKAHDQYIQRIALVDKYLLKDPGKRYVPLPYLYFDTRNPHGFAGTKKWYVADQARKAEVKRELTLSRLIRTFVNNEKKPGRHQQPRLQLFRQCENTLGKLKDPALLQRFHAAVLSQATFHQITHPS